MWRGRRGVARCCTGVAGNGLGTRGDVWRGRVGKSLGLMSFLLLRPVGASGGVDPFCRCTGRKEGAAGRSLCRRCSGGAVSVRAGGPSGLVRAPLSAAPLPPHGGGWKGAAVSAAGFPAGFPGDFCAPFEGHFTRRGETGADALLAGGMMGSLALSLAGGSARAAAEALSFCPAGERLGGGEGLPGGLLVGCARGAGHCAGTGKRVCRGWTGRVPLRHSRGGELGGGRTVSVLAGGRRLAPTARRRIAYGKRGGGLL